RPTLNTPFLGKFLELHPPGFCLKPLFNARIANKREHRDVGEYCPDAHGEAIEAIRRLLFGWGAVLLVCTLNHVDRRLFGLCRNLQGQRDSLQCLTWDFSAPFFRCSGVLARVMIWFTLS